MIQYFITQTLGYLAVFICFSSIWYKLKTGFWVPILYQTPTGVQQLTHMFAFLVKINMLKDSFNNACLITIAVIILLSVTGIGSLPQPHELNANIFVSGSSRVCISEVWQFFLRQQKLAALCSSSCKHEACDWISALPDGASRMILLTPEILGYSSAPVWSQGWSGNCPLNIRELLKTCGWPPVAFWIPAEYICS